MIHINFSDTILPKHIFPPFIPSSLTLGDIMGGIPEGESMRRRERLSTGITKLDQYLNGGIPESSWVFVTDEPGTSKTILCLHIAYTNLKDGLNVIYVTTEQPFTDLVEQAK